MLNVKKIRTRLGVSKYKLCKMTGITKPTLINIEKSWNVHLFTLYKIADALGVDVKELFD